MRWTLPDVDPDYVPIKVREVQNRLVAEDVHRWVGVVQYKVGVPRGRHRR